LPDKGPEHELAWFPCYPEKILSSIHWINMKDFQRGWYWQLLLNMTRSKPIGYLRFDDGRLWTLAGAHSKQYWDSHAGLVLACFKVARLDGHEWIYNQKLLDVLTEQQAKYDNAVKRDVLGVKRKRASSKASLSSSYSKEFEKVWEENTWEKVSKKTAAQAFEKAVDGLIKQPPAGVPVPHREAAVQFLAQAMQEFRDSDAGHPNGLFDDYQPPYPASWLNGQRYLDDRSTWYRTKPASSATVGTHRNLVEDPIAECLNEKCRKKYERDSRPKGEPGCFCCDDCYYGYATWVKKK